MIERFLREWAAVGGHGRQTEDVAAGVREVLAEVGARTFVRYGTPLCDGLDLTGYEAAEAKDADVGIADVTAAAADTGTVVLVPAPERGRVVTLLPPTCIFIVPATLIRPNLGQAIHGLTRWNLVTGPSRSGDIEGELVLGVHGPGRVYALVTP
ncbi:MAG TPA: LUD domain-containing protein [Bacillota bacterium]|nr:LUD domain-containing protein [Bacillota bacterium]